MCYFVIFVTKFKYKSQIAKILWINYMINCNLIGATNLCWKMPLNVNQLQQVCH